MWVAWRGKSEERTEPVVSGYTRLSAWMFSVELNSLVKIRMESDAALYGMQFSGNLCSCNNCRFVP